MKRSAKIAIISGIAIVVIISALAVTVHLRQSAIEGSEQRQETASEKINEAVNAITNANENTVSTVSTACKAVNDILPDPKCTEGAIDPAVTQDNIGSTICVSGYTKTVRPPVSVTEPIKVERMQAYGFTDFPSNYELDHLIPLELGGAPADIRNLWPEPYYTNPNSYDKDKFENYLHDQVCSGSMDLKIAQNEIATNWVKYWDDAGKP